MRWGPPVPHYSHGRPPGLGTPPGLLSSGPPHEAGEHTRKRGEHEAGVNTQVAHGAKLSIPSQILGPERSPRTSLRDLSRVQQRATAHRSLGVAFASTALSRTSSGRFRRGQSLTIRRFLAVSTSWVGVSGAGTSSTGRARFDAPARPRERASMPCNATLVDLMSAENTPIIPSKLCADLESRHGLRARSDPARDGDVGPHVGGGCGEGGPRGGGGLLANLRRRPTSTLRRAPAHAPCQRTQIRPCIIPLCALLVGIPAQTACF